MQETAQKTWNAVNTPQPQVGNSPNKHMAKLLIGDRRLSKTGGVKINKFNQTMCWKVRHGAITAWLGVNVQQWLKYREQQVKMMKADQMSVTGGRNRMSGIFHVSQEQKSRQ